MRKSMRFIVDKALEFKLGARGLRSIVEAVMMDAMYSMPSRKSKGTPCNVGVCEREICKNRT